MEKGGIQDKATRIPFQEFLLRRMEKDEDRRTVRTGGERGSRRFKDGRACRVGSGRCASDVEGRDAATKTAQFVLKGAVTMLIWLESPAPFSSPNQWHRFEPRVETDPHSNKSIHRTGLPPGWTLGRTHHLVMER